MVQEFGNPAGRLVQVTQHHYPFGCAYKNYKEIDITKLDSVDAANSKTGPSLIPVDAAAAREKMLAPAAYHTYESVLHGIRTAIGEADVSFRLTEVNSLWFSGLEGASDRYASALWGLEYLHWWISHGAAGLNFHTGDRTGGVVTMPCRYAAFDTSAHGFDVRPLGYGMKLFALGGHGKQLPVTVSTAPEHRVVAYANLEDDSTVNVTVINKAHGEAASSVDVRIKLDAAITGPDARVISLKAENGEVSADSSKVTIGGAHIEEDGSWRGDWSPLKVPGDDSNSITLTMPPASAAVVKAKIR
jgi:hypothetical protein